MDGVWLRKLRTHPNADMRKMQNQERLLILHEMCLAFCFFFKFSHAKTNDSSYLI